jgi:cell division transport system permease protein
MKTWIRQHRFALHDAFVRLRRMPATFFFNVLVIAIALTLPFAGLTLLENLRPVGKQLVVEPEVSIFLEMDTPHDRATALATDIRGIAEQQGLKAELAFIPRERALASLKERTGMAEALTALGGNPLPDGYVLTINNLDQIADASRIEAVAERLKALSGVEHVQIDSAWIKRLTALTRVLRLTLVLLATTLAVVVIAVVFNTVRLQVMTQREEIAISRLVGATNGFIYRPFYYSGALLGFSAGLLALGGMALSLQPLNSALAEFAHLYAADFRISPLDAGLSLLLVAGTAGLGFVGALLSVHRHLAKLN